MSEAEFDNFMRELRAAAPPAPDRLRERVRDLREPQARRVVRVRRALVVATAIAIAVGLGAAAIGGLTGEPGASEQNSRSAAAFGTRQPRPVEKRASPKWTPPLPTNDSVLPQAGATSLAPGSRLQRYDVSMHLRVRDLSRSTQSAVRQARRLGGYVAAADYATGSNTGDSTLDLRVPVQRVQQAIAEFTDLGTILSQQIRVGDLQAPLDRTEARIAALRTRIGELETKSVRTLAEQAELDAARTTLKRLTRTRTAIVREATYAKISLQLTTRKAAAKHVAPGRFDRFWGDAGDILGKEAIAVLYALVVAGPFAILAALFLLGERARRRRADHRLLEEAG